MAYSVALLGEKHGFSQKVLFTSTLGESAISEAFDKFRKASTGIRKEHLPFRCPIRKIDDDGTFEMVLDGRNLSYNFDSLMVFMADVMTGGISSAAKSLDNGRIGATAYVVTPGHAKKFEYIPEQGSLTRLQTGELRFDDVLVDETKVSVAEYMKTVA